MKTNFKKFTRIIDYNCTSTACPTQYEIKLLDGRMIYLRYRWGVISIRISLEPTLDISDAIRGVEIFGGKIGGDLDGHLSEGQVCNYLGLAGFIIKL